jgi:hypothetical protein
MFDIKVSSHIINHCVDQLKKYNFGKRGEADGDYEKQLVGIIGQSVVSDICGLPLIDGSKGFDGGEDIRIGNYIVDIKTMGRKSRVRKEYVSNFYSLQKNYNTDIYIFASLNKNNHILTVVGWIPKNEFFEKSKFFKTGEKRYRRDGTDFLLTTDLYEIENKYLRIVFDADHMMNQIYMAWKPKGESNE